MKLKLLIITILFNCNLYSQFGGPIIIPSDINGLNNIFSADLDGDGDMDVLSTSKTDNKIVWYENEDGEGTFSNNHIVSMNNDYGAINYVYIADLDNDNDNDIVAAYDYGLVWFENLNGLGIFSEAKLISYDVDRAIQTKAIDIDDDGHKDIVCSNIYNDSQVTWSKNIDGLGNFGPAQRIAGPGINGPNYFWVDDMDGDGDMDVVTSTYDLFFPNFVDNNISWFENMGGNGTFAPKQLIINNAGSPEAITTIDIDNDGDMDIVVASYFDNEVYILENLDGAGNFSDKIVLPIVLNRPKSIFDFDYDNDGFIDILIAADNKVSLIKNDGFGNYNLEIIISEIANKAISVFASTIDNDNVLDVITASSNDNVIAWYKNETLSVENNNSIIFSVFPIPTINILTVDSNSQITNIKIYNELGQLVFQTINKNEIDISHSSKGYYIIRIEDINQHYEIKKILKI